MFYTELCFLMLLMMLEFTIREAELSFTAFCEPLGYTETSEEELCFVELTSYLYFLPLFWDRFYNAATAISAVPDDKLSYILCKILAVLCISDRYYLPCVSVASHFIMLGRLAVRLISEGRFTITSIDIL
jgi:hypothetical protein